MSADVDARVYLQLLTETIQQYRKDDPTKPVTILVSSALEADALRSTFARSSSSQLRLAVSIETVLTAALAGQRMAEPRDIEEFTRQSVPGSFFTPLAGMPGVVSELSSAVELWDRATPEQRDSLLLDDAPAVEVARLSGIQHLYRNVDSLTQAAGLNLMSAVLSHAEPEPDRLWIDSTVDLLCPIELQWLRRLENVQRIAPSEAGEPSSAKVLAAVDPVDEAGFAARTVSSALEFGIAARDIVVVAPATEFDRYRFLIGQGLGDLGVPFDGMDVARVANTSAGRMLTALIAGINAITEPGRLRFDQIRRVIADGSLSDVNAERIGTKRLRTMWEQLRGTDSRNWAKARTDDAAASEIVREVSRCLLSVTEATDMQPQWSALADAFLPLLQASTIHTPDDAIGRAACEQLMHAWSHREGLAYWAEARDELLAMLDSSSTRASGGVRFLPLQAGWSAAAELTVAVGMSDDFMPGVQGAVGPLTSTEVINLRASASDRALLANNGAREWAALLRMSGQVVASYSRSDLLRTTLRQPSRFLDGLDVEHVASVQAQSDRVADGTLGLLSLADAAAATLRAGVPAQDVSAWLDRDLMRAQRCSNSRLLPPVTGGVDEFNGDLSALVVDYGERFSPDFLAHDPENPSASPSRLETLLRCPIGYWAARMVKVDEPQDWDPLTMDLAQRGSWLHQALLLLEQRHGLGNGLPTVDEVQSALWDAVGGNPAKTDVNRDSGDEKLLGFRCRITNEEVSREAGVLARMITKLLAFLDERGGSKDAVPEHPLGPAALELGIPGGAIFLAGRTDRIDTLSSGQPVVTDFKTGSAGSGFQLAVYAWLRLQQNDAEAELLYAHAGGRAYQPVALDPDDPLFTKYSRDHLEDYLIAMLAEPVQQSRQGRFPSWAPLESHSPYCSLCSDLIPQVGGWGDPTRGQRAIALSLIGADLEGVD